MPGIRANAAPYEAYLADLATELPTSTLADTKHTKGDDSPTAIFPTTRTTSYPYTPPTARFETPASPEVVVEKEYDDESDPSVQKIIKQAYAESLFRRGKELSRLGRLARRVGVGLTCAGVGISALAAIEATTGYDLRWESDESSNFPTVVIEAPNTTEVTDPADVANLKRQKAQEARLQSIEGTGIALIGNGLGLAACYAGKKALARFKETEAVLKEAKAIQEG
ncbi:hypothetical protein HG437_003255 [Candidatus Saccharibacteria bacterium]|nr:hypothetical protein [Candidatus Saccharibacteria bacterium]